MQWLVDNWILVLLGGGMIAMHLFGHGRHGGHGGNGGGKAKGGGCCGGTSRKTADAKADRPDPDAGPRPEDPANV